MRKGVCEVVCLRCCRDKVCDPFPHALTVSKKLDSHIAVFDPADDGDFHCQGSDFLCDGNLEGQIGSGIQVDFAPHPATGGGQVEEHSFTGFAIALDVRGIANGDSGAASWLHAQRLPDVSTDYIGSHKENLMF